MDFRIKPTFYHKTVASEDGIIHTADISKKYPGYEVEITAVYLVDNDEKLLECILKDLDRLKETLTEIKKGRSTTKENNDFEK